MYKAYYCPMGNEYYFYLKPKKADMIKVLKKDGNYDEDFSMEDVEITKLKIISNYPED